MLYCALDQDTAHAETFDPVSHSGKVLTIDTFRALRDLLVLDLADLQPVLSVFDIDHQYLIHPLRFPHEFVEYISRPIKRDGQEYIDLIKNRIFTEWFTRVPSTPDVRQIDSIIYWNAKRPTQKGSCPFLKERPVH